jgi:hypothetical protein
MISAITQSSAHLYFENAVGRLSVHPVGLYTKLEYANGPRHFHELLAFLTQAGQLLARWGWDTLLSSGQPVTVPAITAAESDLLVSYWQTQAPHSLELLYAAQLLPHTVFVRLSWAATAAQATRGLTRARTGNPAKETLSPVNS